MIESKMSTYVMGDVHGCYSQFVELLKRVEERDPNARFILVGDIVSRGTEDAQMLAWAYENVTLDGKYQMVLGNHDDDFIEIFGKGEFETVYSLSRYELDYGKFRHLEGEAALMYQYAEFLASQPLVKKLEVNGQKYVIAHAGYPEKIINPDLDLKRRTYSERFKTLWYRDREDYKGGEFEDEYEPVDGEILIHGHTPTLDCKNRMYRIYSPGKIWKRKNSINIDCGLVFNVTENSKYGNLVAYHLESGKATYLWDIVDEYVLNDEEYYEDRKEREKKEREEGARRAKEAWEEFKDPYLQSFYKQVFDLDEVPNRKNREYDASFNFMNDLSRISVFNGNQDMDNYDFDFENVPMIAVVSSRHEKKYTKILYIYHIKSQRWIDIELDVSQFDMTDKFKYQVFKYKGTSYLFGINHYKEEYAEGILYQISRSGAHVLVNYRTRTSGFDWRNEENILEIDQKSDELGKSTGIMTWDFYHDEGEVLAIKIAKNCGGSYYANITNSNGEVVAKISRSYW